MAKTVANAKIEWIAINGKIKDQNSVDAFNLLFNGLTLSIKNENAKMVEILASMDLALVDIIEKYFEYDQVED
ncbi:MAG: hypothetical protein COB17_05215 [Sulfurimonas sp.]|nr:MAG: hypothetical protein COB17_05215 [Sulfurimonas sp.]